MKHLSEYRDGALASKIVARIKAISKKPVRLMEVCGTHTVSIFRYGIRELLPSHLVLISGPGCPVCVTAMRDIDKAIKVARIPDVIVTTFGDLMRVPGSESSLQKEKGLGADVRMVYSTMDALEIARQNPEKKVVFLGIGFETTAPTIAAAVVAAEAEGIKNFWVLSSHKLLPPAMDALLSGGELDISGFICPGHVTTIIGTAPYEPVVAQYHTPCVIVGFEPLDILQGIYMLVTQIEAGQSRVEIQYRRAVVPEGNPNALKTLYHVFEPCDATWRGLGVIPNSGLALRKAYRAFDADALFDLEVPDAPEPPGCQCGDILRGVKTPMECKLFRKACTPENPIGPCMVSVEGTCAAYYKYSRL
ncbi:MAG: hydrogenase formation protein HypD [Deltaproteobacteria bacterium]|nr:hydrogenase formation protein HypD [Deltaproteobacteria bacterium]MBW2020727.1 hydrogenase formation protein HypD [Deltaproteobacteria bacterium]MBW2075643.1 hydrogenase formation protein HypD [Deltaproteobacteria bacterium]RLB80573.1 MAG: hydrogenase formation protein HypD [Deltaproteobacteria bacterium]